MKILISGSTGFVGSKSVPFLERQGYEVFYLVFKNQGLKNEIN
ncbi:MAG: NAD-dependent epimerase/dehydratase family protein [bacterium]